MQLQWWQNMEEFRFALRDFEDLQKCDGKTIGFAKEFFKRIQRHEGIAHEQVMVLPELHQVQEQSGVGLALPIGQPVVSWPQPHPYQAQHPSLGVDRVLTSPYGWEPVALWPPPNPYQAQHPDRGVDGAVTSPYGWQPVAPWPDPASCLAPYPALRVDGLVASPHGYQRPLYPFAYIIGKVILSAPNQQMTSDHIYHWLRDNFGYYRQKGTQFRPIVTEQLSRKSDFVRMPNTAGTEGAPWYGGGPSGFKPRIGHYWKVKPDCVIKFLETVWPLDTRQA